MKQVSAATLDKLLILEEEYSQKNNRLNSDIPNRINNQEKILFCYYEIIDRHWPSYAFFGNRPELLYYILTDLKVCMSYQRDELKGLSIVPGIACLDITLDRIKEVTVVQNSNRRGENGVVINSSRLYKYMDKSFDSITLFTSVKDSEFLQSISSAIRQAKTNFEFRLRSSVSGKPNASTKISTVEQLEKLASLYKSGLITDDEYKRAKDKILSNN